MARKRVVTITARDANGNGAIKGIDNPWDILYAIGDVPPRYPVPAIIYSVTWDMWEPEIAIWEERNPGRWFDMAFSCVRVLPELDWLEQQLENERLAAYDRHMHTL